ncbi:NUDIX domain-containing protein [Pleomorphovibrio marinus]|uniref:NUDIX domain-containing protein n=1 Tax=Pleomorphovibrio marinus TaxID=2164132 RepID=UPI000E09E60D|nr:NUDIX hydrolase [Pleomorphovibrio marinus]
MSELKREIEQKFGGRLRTRVNGILIKDEKLLMVRHKMGEGKIFWNVPGGGMKYGSSAEQNVIREFKEETGLVVDVNEFLFIHEFLNPPLHAIELFFEVKEMAGQLELGGDPELSPSYQVIDDIRYLSVDEIKILGKGEVHDVFLGINSIKDVRMWKGYFNFENNSIK